MGRKPVAQLQLEDLAGTVEEPAVVETRWPRRKERPDAWRFRFRLAALVAAALAVVFALLWLTYQVDQFLATHRRFVLPAGAYGRPNNPYLRIEGPQHLVRDEIERLFAQDFGRSIYLAPLADRRRELMAIDWVRDASVSRRWPNRLVVRVAERAPVAFAALPPPGAPKAQLPHELALIDADGVILRTPAQGDFPLPILFGLTRKLDRTARRDRIALVLNLLEDLKAHAGQISEIDVGETDNLKVTQAVEGRAVRLLLGRPPFLSRVNNFLLHYPEISRRLPNASTFDLRLDNRITAVEGSNAR